MIEEIYLHGKRPADQSNAARPTALTKGQCIYGSTINGGRGREGHIAPEIEVESSDEQPDSCLSQMSLLVEGVDWSVC